MKFRTGDILIWRSTSFYDVLGENIIQLKGYHSGLIMTGKKIGTLSECGISPSNTYITFMVDHIYPIEEVVGHVWTRYNGASLHLIKRMTGRDISDEEAYRIFTNYIQIKKVPWYRTAHLSCAAYLNCGGIAPKSCHKYGRYHLCSSLNGYMLQKFGFIDPKAEVNDLLPVDFFNVRFYQIEKYRIQEIFDKETWKTEWWFAGFFLSLGILKSKPVTCRQVNEILQNYDYPRIKYNRNRRKVDGFPVGC